jgi:hypothetical protein
MGGISRGPDICLEELKKSRKTSVRIDGCVFLRFAQLRL